MDRKELEALAKKLGIEFDEETSDEDLEKAVKDKEEEVKKKEKDGDPEYLKSELKKVIDQRDTAKRDRKALKKQIDDFKEKMGDSVNQEDFDNLKTQLDELKEFKTKADKEKEEADLAKLNDVEKANLRAKKAEEALVTKVQEAENKVVSDFQKQLDNLKVKLDESDDQVKSLRKNRLESEIITVATKNKAIDPSHIFKMLRSEFEYDSDLGKFIHPVKDTKGKLVDEQDVDEYVKGFLESEENDYLIGSTANRDPIYTKKGTTYDKNIDGYNPKDPELIEAADREKMDVMDYIETRKIRDKKMKLVEEASKNKE